MAFLPFVRLIRSLPVARSAHGATVYDDKLWIFAGYDGNARWEARLKPPSPPCDPGTNRNLGINCHVFPPPAGWMTCGPSVCRTGSTAAGRRPVHLIHDLMLRAHARLQESTAFICVGKPWSVSLGEKCVKVWPFMSTSESVWFSLNTNVGRSQSLCSLLLGPFRWIRVARFRHLAATSPWQCAGTRCLCSQGRVEPRSPTTSFSLSSRGTCEWGHNLKKHRSQVTLR